MPDQTGLPNDALGQIGANRVTAIDDESINGKWCQILYPPLLDAELTAVHWKFAKKRQELAQDAIAPIFEFAYGYTLPADPWCLKVIEYNGANLDTSNLSLFEATTVFRFKIEGRSLLTNDGSVKIVFLARIEDPNQWSGMFYQGLAAKLASKLALAIPKDSKKAKDLWDLGDSILSQAAAIDGQQGSVEPMRADDLIWGR